MPLSHLPLDDAHLRRLLTVGQALVRELDLDGLLEEVLIAGQELTGATYAAVGVINEERTGLARFLTRGMDGATRTRIGAPPTGKGILGAVISSPEPLRLENLNDDPRSAGFPPGHPPMRTFLGVPISMRGTSWGNLYLTDKRTGPFDATDEASVTVLADWAAAAIENADLYARLRRQHEEAVRANRRLEATTEVARAIGDETELERVLELIVERAAELVAARATIVLIAASDDTLEVTAGAGDTAQLRRGVQLPVEGTTTGEVFRDRVARLVEVQDLLVQPDVYGIVGMRTALLVPMVFHERSVGVLVAVDPAETDTTPHGELQALLAAFASSAATAVATAQSVGHQRIQDAIDAAEEERRRWARELHDETLQGLAGLRVQLAAVLGEGASDPAAKGELLGHVDEEIQKLRTVITELRPAALDELGLTAALESLTDGVRATGGLALDLAVDLGGRERLPASVETLIYRITQEALRNVVKHARAQRAVVELTVAGTTVDLLIRDDGVGVDTAALQGRDGFGVTGMRERAVLAGGSLTLEPGAYGGTRLRVRVPLRPPSEAAVRARSEPG